MSGERGSIIAQSRRELLQQEAGGLGRVPDRVVNTDAGHRYVGWYIRPALAAPGCDCEVCRAARLGIEAYIGFKATDAIYALRRHAEDHEGLELAPPPAK